ncbi:unnamed protein product [Prorocentrum cordatum]|uniref:Uncharacterized protein n=1 Tax=Prorocentrum cordatum TaxID=2364126 RepID=A0ABN9RUT4_9DINO|nr:unnamed protein product [Polarella glacialis]
MAAGCRPRRPRRRVPGLHGDPPPRPAATLVAAVDSAAAGRRPAALRERRPALQASLPRRPAAAAAVVFAIAATGSPVVGGAEEWRVINNATVHGEWVIAEVSFFSDDDCRQRIEVVEDRLGLHPTASAPQGLAGRCRAPGRGVLGQVPGEGLRGYCSWCGEGNACCKRGAVDDPPECAGVTSFSRSHHECVAVRTASTCRCPGTPSTATRPAPPQRRALAPLVVRPARWWSAVCWRLAPRSRRGA